MGRKGFKAKLLMFLMTASTVITGILGSVPLPVKAAEEGETYTVTFVPYEGTCDTENVSVPRGESIILPDGYYEGHYLESWMDITDRVTEEGTVTKFTAVGRPGSSYTPERSLWLHANWKPNAEQEITAEYEAKIGDNGYEQLEEAFANAQAGDTITVLKDCEVSDTLEVTAANITLKSEDAGNPVSISREEGFVGKSYGSNTDTVLLAVAGGSLTTQDIIFDGGAVLDGDFNNSGKSWNSPLIYVDGSYAVESGTVLQNNYNTDGYEGSGRSLHTAGAVHIRQGGNLTMDHALIQNCYTSGGGGGIRSEESAHVSASSSTITGCYAGAWGGGMLLYGDAELSDMDFSGNRAGSTGGALYSKAPLTVTDCLIEGNSSGYDGGGICTATGHRPKLIRCTFTGNSAGRGSAVQTIEGEGTEPLEIHDCIFKGNLSWEKSYAGGTICYMNETGIILAGNIVMEDNLTVGASPCDILFFYNTGASILLNEDFESSSTFVLGGFPDVIKPGRVLIDGAKFHKEASPEQFPWHVRDYCTEKRGENLYLAEVPETYSVSYDANNSPTGASDMCSDPNLYTSEDVVAIMGQAELFPLMGNIVNFGYDFAGWNTEPDGTGTDYEPGQEIHLTDNLYLYAKWEAKEPVTLTYIYNDGEGRTDSAQVIPEAHIAFPDASRKGYRFTGWYEDEELTVFAGNAGEKHYAPQTDTSYYAAWEKTEAEVTFDADGGEMEGGNITAKIGDTITLPTCTKEDYDFAGWYDGDTCVGNAGEEYTVADDVTLKAHYIKKEAPACIVTFDTDGGKEISPIKVEKGKSVHLPEAEKENHIFLGWYTEKENGEKADAELTVTEDITLYAHWEKEAEKPEERPEATIIFDADGGEMEGGEITVKVGDTITLPACIKEGYEFAGWYDDDTCVGNAGDEYTVTGDITLKAHYTKKEMERPEATITFDADGGEMEGGEITARVGDSITLPSCTKEGYEFAGWYDGDTCVGNAGEKYTVTGDVILKANYEKKEEITYLITFDPNGGIKAEHIRAAKGEKITLPGTKKSGYVFLGWYTEKTGGILLGIAGDELEVTKDMTVYALWEKENAGETGDKEPETCKAVFHTQGGTLKNKTLTVIKGAGLYFPLPEKKGYDFAGWYLDQSLKQFAGAYRDAYRITKDTDFYAKWKKAKEDTSGGNDSEKDDTEQGSNAETFTVKYDANGGTVKESSVKVEKGKTVNLPTAEREGFTFKGWYTAKQTFIGKAGSSYQPKQDITLFAKWDKTASGDSNGNTGDKNNSDTKTGTSTSGTVTDKSAGTSASGTVTDKSIGTSASNTAAGQNTGATASDAEKNKNADNPAGNTETGVQKEPVIQTGCTTPIYLFASIGFFGILLVAFSVREGKRSSNKKA